MCLSQQVINFLTKIGHQKDSWYYFKKSDSLEKQKGWQCQKVWKLCCIGSLKVWKLWCLSMYVLQVKPLSISNVHLLGDIVRWTHLSGHSNYNKVIGWKALSNKSNLCFRNILSCRLHEAHNICSHGKLTMIIVLILLIFPVNKQVC